MKFKNIGILGRNNQSIAPAINSVCDFLAQNHLKPVVDHEVYELVANKSLLAATTEEIRNHCDLAIVVGGDGSILQAARNLAGSKISVIGVHKGRLGFLTDIAPDKISEELAKILQGDFIRQELSLLHADIIRKQEIIHRLDAVNEAVLNSGNVTKMIEFDVYTNEQFMFRQRSDGLIIATPTGSTAYAMSGGGPILTPNLRILTLVPMFPHSLTSRPIVIGDDSIITIKPIDLHNGASPGISCDGQPIVSLAQDDKIQVYKSGKVLHLLHPSNYNYYETLRTKLHWGRKPV
jgi:NAD+ kinase